MADALVSVERLTKTYGRARGVVDLSFDVQPGEVFGFLGPNGAGKTTTIRLLLDLIRPTAGRVVAFGRDVRSTSREVRARTGYLSGDLRLYERLAPREHLRYLPRSAGCPASATANRSPAAWSSSSTVRYGRSRRATARRSGSSSPSSTGPSCSSSTSRRPGSTR